MSPSSDPLRPTAGVRILLERMASQPVVGASYHGAIITPEARCEYDVAIAADATVTLTASGAPEIANDRARDLLRSIARTMARHALSSSPPAWPRRVLRWRKIASPASGSGDRTSDEK